MTRNKTARKLKASVTLLVFALFAASLVVIGLATGWQETIDALSKLSLTQVLILLALSLINYGFRALRWHVYTQSIDIPTTLFQNARHYLGGFALTATPGRLGELIRLRWIWLETGQKPEKTGALALIDRAADLASVGLLLGASVLASSNVVTGGWYVAGLAVIIAILATNPALVRFGASVAWKTTGILPRFFATIRRAARALVVFARGSVSATSAVLGMLGWCAEAFAFYLLLLWMGAEISLALAFAIFFFSMLTGGATGLPGGIGGAEAAMIAALTFHNIPMEIALPATAVIRITTLWFAILIGMLVFPVAERAANRQGIDTKHALEPTEL